MASLDISKLISEGALIDNKRKLDSETVTVKEIIRSLAKDSEGLKCAVGYFYLQGLALIINELQHMKEIKILMGSQTTKLTKTELIKTFKDSFDKIDDTQENISSIILFHKLVKEKKTLQILAYFGKEGQIERLHAKAYLFLQDLDSQSILKKYLAGIVGSSNLTPSGLMGNTELNVLLRDGKDLEHLEKWFEDLWKHGSEDFEKLTISEIITKSIQESKFGKYVKETFVYSPPEEFFKILINHMNADYLFDDWKESKLLAFQQVDAMRCLRLFNEKNYRGVFLTSSVGLGKSYVASQTAKYFVRDNKKVLIIAPSGLVENEEQWPRYISEFNLKGKVDLVGMGMLQKDTVRFDTVDLRRYDKDYSLIVVDEAHNYRNPDSNRARNLKRIFDRNGNSKLLFLTATPINTSLEDLVNLIGLFYRPGQNLHFDRLFRLLHSVVEIIRNTPYEKLTKIQKKNLIETQEEIEKEFFVKSTRGTIKTSPEYLDEIKSFTHVDISKIPDPDVGEVVYSLDEKYKEIVNGIVNFISDLKNAHLRILDPEKGRRLGPFFKWILYKRFESDISSYYLTLRRILKKNQIISKVIETENIKFLEIDENIELDDAVEVKFDKEYKEKMSYVINLIKKGKGKEHLDVFNDLKHDIGLIDTQIKNLSFFLQNSENILFIDDKKLSTLLEIIRKNNSKKILIFTEYSDTLLALKQYLSHRFLEGEIAFVESNTHNKKEVIDKFNDTSSSSKILISTDTLSEGFNISGADVVVNFDIPYNPVRLIQRIGRATRLDVPKKISVLNFRPDSDIDKEIILVDRLQFRIEDIIRFIGLEYRIWFEKEEELLKERRKMDIKVYQDTAKQIFKDYRRDLWNGKFENLEVAIQYSNPIIALLQKAITHFGITRDDIKNTPIDHNTYTLLKGKKDLVVFHGNSQTFNENKIQLNLDPFDKKIVFEKTFPIEFNKFTKYLESIKRDELILSYYNDKIDKQVRTILDRIYTENMEQYMPATNELKKELLTIKEKCGDKTPSIVRELHKNIKSKITNEQIKSFIKKLQSSYIQKSVQTKLKTKEKPLMALGFLEE